MPLGGIQCRARIQRYKNNRSTLFIMEPTHSRYKNLNTEILEIETFLERKKSTAKTVYC